MQDAVLLSISDIPDAAPKLESILDADAKLESIQDARGWVLTPSRIPVHTQRLF
jgi:hypothetical protein